MVKHLRPPPPCSGVFQESQVLLTLTNPVESITHVTLAACEEEDPDAVNSTARVLNHSRAHAFPRSVHLVFRGNFRVSGVFSDQSYAEPAQLAAASQVNTDRQAVGVTQAAVSIPA